MGLATFLEPGEVVRYEAQARGWPPSPWRFLLLSGALLAWLAWLDLVGGALRVHVGPLTYVLPMVFLGLPALAIVQLWRVAAFRSRVHAVTDRRVLTVGGVLRARVLLSVPRDAVRAVMVRDGAPGVFASERHHAFAGLDALDLESIREALGGPLLLADPVRQWPRRAKGIFVVFIGLFVVAASIEAEIQRRGHDEFWRLEKSVEKAFNATIARLGGSGGGYGTEDDRFEGRADLSYQAWSRERGTILDLRVIFERPFSFLGRRWSVRLEEGSSASGNAHFFELFRKEIAPEGLEVSGPESRRE